MKALELAPHFDQNIFRQAGHHNVLW